MNAHQQWWVKVEVAKVKCQNPAKQINELNSLIFTLLHAEMEWEHQSLLYNGFVNEQFM